MMAGQMAVGLATSAPFPSLGTLLHSTRACPNFITANCIRTYVVKHAIYSRRAPSNLNNTRRTFRGIPGSTGSSSSEGSQENVKSSDKQKAPFGYTRKDVLLIGLGVTLVGVGLKSGLEFIGVDPLQAGNVVQLFIVLGLTVGWVSTYMFRVANKDMTYAQQLRDYENKVMEKRLEGLTEAELQALLEQVEEEKSSLASSDQLQKLN